MDPRAYCQEAITELLAERARRGWDPDIGQRAILLSYLLERRLSAPDFEHRLKQLSASAHPGQPGVATAARAILADWQARAAHPGRRAWLTGVTRRVPPAAECAAVVRPRGSRT